MRRSASFVCAAVLLTHPARAACSGTDPDRFVTPGVVGSFDISHRWAFGLGLEVSYSKWIDCETPIGPGAFASAVHYFAPVRGRFAVGAQANYWAAGAEAGWSLMTGSNDDYGLGVATGPFVGGFLSGGYYMVALRGSFASFGDTMAGTLALDFAMKFPLGITSRGLAPLDIVPLDASH